MYASAYLYMRNGRRKTLTMMMMIQCAYILHNYKLKAHDACVLHVQLQYTYVQHVQLLLQPRRPAV